MNLVTILLIVLAAVVAFIVLRVGLGSREAAPAHGSAEHALPADPDSGAPAGSAPGPEEQAQIDHRDQADHRRGSQRPGRRHGCC